MSVLEVPIANKYNILGVRIDNIRTKILNTFLIQLLEGKLGELDISSDISTILTPNPEFVLLAKEYAEAKQIFDHVTLSLPDGVGLQFASVALTGCIIQERHTGVDIAQMVIDILNKYPDQSPRILLVGDNKGGAGGIGALERARRVLADRYTNVQIDIEDPGVLEELYNENFARKTLRKRYHVIFVALPMPIQLDAICVYTRLAYGGVVMGVGGAFDMIGESVHRAPRFLQRIGFEWLWRFMKEPSRYRRMYRATIVFPLKVAYTTWEQGELFPAIRRVFHYLLTGTYVRH